MSSVGLISRNSATVFCNYRSAELTTFESREEVEAQRTMEKVPLTPQNRSEQLRLFQETRALRAKAIKNVDISDSQILRMYPRLTDMVEAVRSIYYLKNVKLLVITLCHFTGSGRTVSSF